MASVDIRVAVRGQDEEQDWTDLTIVQTCGKHVVASVTHRQKVGERGSLSGRSFYRDRSHVRVDYGIFPSSGGGVASLMGYITTHHVSSKKRDRRGPYVQVTYYITGTSYPLQTVHHWAGWSWSSAAKEVARRHKLKARVHTTPRLAKRLTQTTSDFRFLADGAEQIGYRFYVDGAVLYFLKPSKMLNASMARNTPTFGDVEIINFDVRADEESHDAVDTIIGTAPSGQTIQVNVDDPDADPLDDDGESDNLIPAPATFNDALVESYAEADNARTATSVTWVTADLEAHGNVRVRPCTVINIGGEIPDDFIGLWMATTVKHIIDLNKSRRPADAYRIEAVLGRDRMRAIPIPAAEEQTTDSTDDSNQLPWEVSGDVEATDDDSDAIEIDGVWQSEFYGDATYA